MPLSNPWVGYFTRSYEQIKAAILTALGTNVPEITDHTESNPIVKEISIWAGIAEMLGYYIDAMAREAYTGSMRLLSSAFSISAQLDYRIHSVVAATAEVTFYTDANISSNYSIPVGTVLTTEDGIVFVTTRPVVMNSGTSTINAPVIQREATNSYVSYLSDGSVGQTFQVPAFAADGLLTVKVDGVTWTPKETLAYSNSADQHYIQTVDPTGVMIKFGDGIMGKNPSSGSTVFIYYYLTQGPIGNVGQNNINTIVSALAIPPGATSINVLNNSRAAGGALVEDIESLRHHIPLSLRVMDRAVTRQDYIDNAELVGGIAKAGVVYNCGKWVDIYIIPVGGGIASPVLTNAVTVFIEPRRMITTRVRVFPAGEVRVLINVNVKVLPGFDVALTVQAVKDALALFLSYQNQDIGGGLFLSDLYQQIEAVEGVSNSLITSSLFRPYALPTPPTTLALSWTVAPQPSVVVTSQWRLQAISSTQFHLFRNDVFQGTVTVGVPYVFPEVSFTLSAAAYTVGDAYTFWTYPGNIGIIGSVVLQEPSIFVALTTDVSVTLI